MKQTVHFKPTLQLACIAGLLAGCASTQPPVAATPGMLKVEYSTQFIDGSRLKEAPTEVTIVKREQTTKAVAAQVGLNVLMLALGGGVGFQGFGKDDLKGVAITGVDDRGNLKNPVSGQFVTDLQAAVDQVVKQAPALRDKTYKKSLVVAGGSAQLVYENLAGNDEEKYRLKTYVMVYKPKEVWSLMPNPPINCQEQSPQPMLMSQWADDNFLGIKTQLDEMLVKCQKMVLAELPKLLAE